MAEGEWYYVKHWWTFQHYKNRNPSWIKLYRGFFTDPATQSLTDFEQTRLLRLYLYASDQDGRIPSDARIISRLIGLARHDLTSRLLARLEYKGLISKDDIRGARALPASKPLAPVREEKNKNLLPPTPQVAEQPLNVVPFVLEPPQPNNKNHKRVPIIWNYYVVTIGRSKEKLIFTPARQRMGELRFEDCLLKTGNDPDKAQLLMESCIDAMAASKFHHGENEKGIRYLGWENLFDSTKRLEMWIERSLNGNAASKNG